jgi:integration host factor subunit alpha
MSLTKALLIDRVYNICGCSKSKATELTDSILETIKKSLESGEDVLITGFGKFCIREKNARRGRNPYTGEDLPLEARRVVTFRCSKLLKDRINEKS